MTDLLTAPPTRAVDDRVGGRYLLGERLGSGRTSTVYAAHDERLGRRVAVRLFDGAVPSDVLAAAAATWTPGMSRVLDAGSEVDGAGHAQSYLVRVFVPGVSLAQLVGVIECRAATTAALGAGVAVTLAALHLQGAGHGAVHGRNIFVPAFATSPDWSSDADGATMLTDFGLGGRRCDPRDDIRTLGMTLLGVLTGRTVVGSRTTRAALSVLARHGGAGIASRDRAGWLAVLAAMTHADPASRPRAVEAAATLATLRGGPLTRL